MVQKAINSYQWVVKITRKHTIHEILFSVVNVWFELPVTLRANDPSHAGLCLKKVKE